MTREEAIEVIEQDIPCEHDRDLIEALDMAISALSTEGEYISKEDISRVLLERMGANKSCAIKARELGNHDSEQYFDTLLFEDGQISSLIEESSENKVVKIENTTVAELKNILNWGHCYCDSEGLPAYKAIKNAIEIITSLERLKAEIKNNTEHCECVPDGSCIRVAKVLEIIDKYINTETWNGYHGTITAPKGTFDRIYEECKDSEDDI